MLERDYCARMLPLPDPPADLAAAPRAFYDELREMLEIVRPADLDTGPAATAERELDAWRTADPGAR